ATTGVPELKLFGADVAVGFRSLLQTYEFLGTLRLRLARQDPFAFAVFGTVGGGGGFNGKNQFSGQTGLLGSILFAGVVTVPARASLDLWTDRLCAKDDSGVAQGTDVCKNKASAQDLAKAAKIHGSSDFFARDSGARFYVSLVTEVALRDWMNF